MAGSRSLISLLLALSAFLVIMAVSADDSGSSILTPIAETPMDDYEGADAPTGFDDAEAPDAGLLGSPVAGTTGPEGDATPAPKHSGASNLRTAAAGAVAAGGAFVGYLVF